MIENTVYLGTTTHYYLVTAEGERFTAYEQNRLGPGAGARYTHGEAVWLDWPPDWALPVADG